jgi:hypothetical protein
LHNKKLHASLSPLNINILNKYRGVKLGGLNESMKVMRYEYELQSENVEGKYDFGYLNVHSSIILK